MKSLSVLTLLMILLLMRTASAQSGSGEAIGANDPPGYREAILLAVEEYAEHNFPEAREQFQRAHELQPSARTLRGLGATEFELRNYRESAGLLERALASKVKPLDAQQRAELERLLARARSYLGTLALNVVPEVSSVIVDGEQIELEADKRLVLEVGNHLLEFSAPGRAPTRRTVRVEGGRVHHLSVELPPAVAHVAPEQLRPLAREREASAPPLYKRWWLWTLVGVAVVSAGVVSALALTRPAEIRHEGTFTTNRPPGPPLTLAFGG